ERLDVGALLVDRAKLAGVVAEAQEARVQQAAVDALDVERIEALRPERPAVRRLDDDAPARARVERAAALLAHCDDRGRILPRGALDPRRLAGLEAAAPRAARPCRGRLAEQRV